MAQSGLSPDSPDTLADLDENTPELPSSSTRKESATSENVTQASKVDLRESSAEPSGSSSSDNQPSSSYDQPSCSYDQPSCSRDHPSSSTTDQEPSSTCHPENIEKIKSEIRRKLNEKSKVSYNILLLAADVDHHVRSVCDIGQMLSKAGHHVCLAHTLGHKVTALDHGIEFMEIDGSPLDVLRERPTDWICRNLQNFHAQPEHHWKAWDDRERETLSRLAFEYNATNRIFEKQFSKFEKVYDVIIGNFETQYPCTYFTKIPFIPVTYMNPLPLHKDGPPPFSGYPTSGGRDRAQKYRLAQFRIFAPLVWRLQVWWNSQGVPPLHTEKWWVEKPKQLGIYRYPEKLEYTNIGPKTSPNWFRIDPDCEKFESTKYFELPRNIKFVPGKIIYVNLGNFGQAEPEWMVKFLDLLGQTSYGYIYSQGTRIVETPENVWSAQNLDDASVIPKVDLVITHGGSGSLMRIIYHKKPMIVLPLFLDQYDNAQRVVECGIGRRLDTTCLNTTTLTDAIETTLSDPRIPSRLAEISKDMQTSDSRLQLRYKIEEICREYREKWEDMNRY